MIRNSKIALALLGVAACQQQAPPPDPLAEARAVCANTGAESEARTVACSALIESRALDDATLSEALAFRGEATAEAGDVTAAQADFIAALEAQPENMRAVKGRAAILIESGQLDAAEPLVNRLIAGGAFAADAHFMGGQIAQLRGDFAAASAAYDRAIAADASHARAFANRAAIKQRQNDFPGALADYDAALAINPQLTPALAGRCWARVLSQGAETGARADANAAAEADPRNVEAQLCRGLLQLRAGEWANARASYEAALEVEPGNPAALFGRGVARRRSGDGAGRADMNRARDFSPNIGSTFDDLGVETF